MSRLFGVVAGAMGRGAAASLNVAAWVAGRTARMAVDKVPGYIAAPVTSVVTREVGYQTEAATTNNVPDPQSLLHAYWTRNLTLGKLRSNLAYNGIPFEGFVGAQANQNTDVWQGVLTATRPELDIATVVDLYQQGRFEEDRAREKIWRKGITRLEDTTALLWHRGWFGLQLATSLWHQGLMDDEGYRQAMFREGIGQQDAQTLLYTQRSTFPIGVWEQWWLAGWISDNEYRNRLRREGFSNDDQLERALLQRNTVPLAQVVSDFHLGIAVANETERRFALHGYGRPEDYKPILEAQTPYDPTTALRFYYRGVITDDSLRRHLLANGIGEGRQAEFVKGMRPIPGPTDLVSFAVHEAWSPEVVGAMGYDAEFPGQLSWFMQRQGWDEAEAVPANFPGGGGAAESWARLYWRAHWRPMTEQQAHICFHRLDPVRIGRYQARVPGVEPFVWADYERALKILDYPPKVRKWIAAASASVLDIRVVRKLYKFGLRDRDWLVNQVMDRGYVREDAEAVADTEDAIIQWENGAEGRAAARAVRRKTINAVVESYKIGAMSRAEALGALRELEVKDDVAQKLVHVSAAEENLALVKDSLIRLRKGYLAGEFAAAELPGALAAIGITPEMIPRYLARWNTARTFARRQMSTAKLLHYVNTNRMSVGVASQRLANLGWTNPDILLMLSEAAAKQTEFAAKQAEADKLARTKKARELEKLRAEAERVKRRAENDLKRLTPLTTLKKWVCEAIVSPQWAGERMQAMGYPDNIVSDYIKQWASESIGKNGEALCAEPKSPEGEPPAAPPPPPQPEEPKSNVIPKTDITLKGTEPGKIGES